MTQFQLVPMEEMENEDDYGNGDHAYRSTRNPDFDRPDQSLTWCQFVLTACMTVFIISMLVILSANDNTVIWEDTQEKRRCSESQFDWE